MKITKNSVVAVSYELEVEGKVADKAGAENPLEYIHGTGMLIPGFEAALDGKEPSDSFDFILQPAEGYGEHNPKYKFDIPKSSFEVEGKLREDLLQVGRLIPMLNSAGQVVQGTIAVIGEDKVTMDFNHPMAGKVLHFSGKVESVREATAKELEEGLHGEYLPQEEEHHCCHHGEGHECHKGEGEGCCHHGEGHGCHGEGHGCHGEGHGEGHCCHEK